MRSKIVAFTLWLLWQATATYAQTENSLTVPDILVSRGSTTTMSVNMENSSEIVAVQFTLEMPDGVSIYTNQVVKSERLVNHTVSVSEIARGKYVFVIMSDNNEAIFGNSGSIFSVKISIGNSLSASSVNPITISEATMCLRSGENVLQKVNGGKITIKSPPRLHVVSVDCSEPVAGQPMTIKWKVRNDGLGDTSDTGWKDIIWLVPNVAVGTSMIGSKLLKSVDNVSALAPGESYDNTVNVTLDERIYGNYDLMIASKDYDTSDSLFYKHIHIQVPPLPDIQVPRVVVEVDNSNLDLAPSPINSAGLASSSAFYSGKKVKVTATIANKGGADINGTIISNILYISNTPDLTSGKIQRLASHSMRLSTKAGESVSDEFTATIPYEWHGDTYFIVDADVNNAVYELANTANNSGASNVINTLLTPGADFETYNLNVASQISSGKPFDISYQVRNIGAGVPFSNSWTDKVYISSKNTGLDSFAKQIGSFIQRGSYKQTANGYEYQGDNYTVHQSVSVSGLQPGTYYVYVKTDADNAVMEYEGEDNNVIMSKAVLLSDPDLTAEIISISEETLSTDSKVAVAWRLKNVGTADIQNAKVTDGFFAASNANGSNAIRLGTVTNTISIVAGGEKTLRTNITIPRNNLLNGTRYLFVKTNTNNALAESSTANNSSLTVTKNFVYVDDPAEIKLNGTNLTISDLEVPSTTIPGESLSLSYHVKNTGSLAIDKVVNQEVFISKSSNFDSSAKPLAVSGDLPNLSGLQAGATVTAHVNITIPTDMKGGQTYIYVVINRDKAIVEKKSDDNQEKSPVYVNGNLPHLEVSNLVVPSTIMTSEKTEVSWTVGNTGSWEADDITCAVYLSTDAALSSNDKQLAAIRSGKLEKGGMDRMKVSIEIPDDVIGTRYLIVKAVTSDIEEMSVDNNVQAQQFTSKQSPLPDLSLSSLATEGALRGGQSVTIKATVKNVGDSSTRSDKWTDVFYLSESNMLDIGKAIKLGSKMHVGKMAKDDLYEVSADVIIPANAKGNFTLFAVTDGTSTIIEKNKINNQTKVTVYIQDPSETPADLAVTKINVLSRIMASDVVTIDYTIANQGEYDAKGVLRDVLYMSKDNQWDKNDTMVGVVTGEVSIEAGSETTRTVTGRITNIPEGDYYLIVRTNSTHAIAENNYENNQTVALSASSVAFQTISLGSSVTVNTSGLYKLPLHSGLNGKTIGLYLSTPENTSAGLYTAYEQVPSTARYEHSSSDIETAEQEVLIPNVVEGNYYILAQDNAAINRSLNEFFINGEQELTESTMTLSAREVQFGATTLGIKEGGNNGWISTEIHGALLDSIMDFRLVREEEIIPAESITFHDQTSSKATFNLNDVETGSYDVISELPNGTQAILPDGFKVVPGTNVALGVRLDAPRATRIDGFAPVTVSYANGGNTDIMIRELLLVIRGGQLSETIEGFKTNPLTELHIHPEVKQDNRGFVIIPPGKQETVNYYFRQTASSTYLNLYIIK